MSMIGANGVRRDPVPPTIARCHAHLVPERLPFLDALPERAFAGDLIDLPGGVTPVRLPRASYWNVSVCPFG